MQFKVPQDVQQADRIVAFLTLPQLIICVIGFAIAYGVYTALNSRGLTIVFWLPPVLVIGGLTISFAFLRIANLPFHQYLALLIERFITPSKRVWVKGSDRVIGEENYVSPEEKKQQELAKKNTAMQTEKEEKLGKIGEITDILDALKKEPEPLQEIDQTPDKDLLQKAFLEKIEPEKAMVPLPKKVEKPLEEKILEISSIPKPQQPMVKAPIAEVKTMPVPTEKVTPQATPLQNIADDGIQKKKRKRRRRKKRSGMSPEGGKPPEQAVVQNKGPSVPPVPPVPSVPSAPSAPPLPSWLEEKAETAKELPTSEVKTAEAKTPPPQAIEVKKEPAPVEKNPPVPPVPSTSSPSEELLPAPPVEPALPSPEEHLALEEEYADAPITEAPPTKTAKVSQEFSADDLKKGQTIQFSSP